MINPNGVLYNPASISNVLNALLDDSYDDSEMVFLGRDGFWHSWMHTNKFYGNDKATFTTSLESIRKQAKCFLKQADVLVITWGRLMFSAFVEKLKRLLAIATRSIQPCFRKNA